MFPPSGAKDVPPDAQLRLTFAAAPVIGSGKAHIMDAASNTVVETIDVSTEPATQTIGGLPNFKYYPVIINANEATIYPRNGTLTYGKTYSVTFDIHAHARIHAPLTTRRNLQIDSSYRSDAD
ncbi:MAG TPA: Ig-like domain-containing protein [Tepidisphaeraceae bacterium]